MKIMLWEMKDLAERCGKVESNYRAAQQHWQAKWTKIYDDKYLEIVKEMHRKKSGGKSLQ